MAEFRAAGTDLFNVVSSGDPVPVGSKASRVMRDLHRFLDMYPAIERREANGWYAGIVPDLFDRKLRYLQDASRELLIQHYKVEPGPDLERLIAKIQSFPRPSQPREFDLREADTCFKHMERERRIVSLIQRITKRPQDIPSIRAQVLANGI